jgi:hypothetical protein
MAYGIRLEAEWEDGFVLTEGDDDVNPWGEGNTFTGILIGHETHGRLVRFSVLPHHHFVPPPEARSVRPIYYREMQMQLVGGEAQPAACVAHWAGYQYNDENGTNHKHVELID